jgi:hypothetical protein
MRKIWALPFFLLMFIPTAFSANWYVRKGASGSNNGSDWNNAWTDFNNINFSTVACGDTVWVAGGSYSGSMSINKSCTSSAVLSIKRVLSTDSVPVAAAGWSSSYDSQVVNNNGTITWAGGSYVTVDGRVGDAHSSAPYGIQYLYTGNGVWAVSNSKTAISNMTLAHVELYGPSCATAGTCTGNVWGVNLNQSANTNVRIDHCWIHRFAEVIRPYQTTNLVIQNSYIGEDAKVTPADHEDLIYAADPTSMQLINDWWYDSGNDGIFCDYNGCNIVAINNIFFHNGGWHAAFGKTGSSSTVVMYNNIFESDGSGEYSPAWIGTGGASLASGSDFANNIFYNSHNDGGSGGGLSSYTRYSAGTNVTPVGNCTGCFNYTQASPLCSFAGWVNMCPSSSPDANLVTADFHLTASGKTTFQAKGVNLSASCNTYPALCSDMDGNPRPATGQWTLGPYEANLTQSAAPTAPTSLSATVQ